MMATNTTRLAILNLYKRCLQSIKRMPLENHRLMYYNYTRDSFRKTNSPFTVLERMKDAEEQLERMNYYHSVRAQQQQTQHITNATNNTERPPDSVTTNETVSNEITTVRNWILKVVPFLNTKDVALYANHLVEDGFDSVDIIEQELTPDDLDFMKKAHKRALVRYLEGCENK